MGIAVAARTVGEFGAMGGRYMAGAALGHQLRPILFNRAIGVESGVAVFALELVAAAIIFQIAIDTDMALATLDGSQGHRLGSI